MKKLFLSILTLTGITAAANAQIKFAPEAGLNMANMAITDTVGTISTSLKAGFTAGGIVEIGLSKKLFLQPGLFYMMNGAKISTGGGSFTVHTIQIPVNVEYKVGDEGSVRFFIAGGPYVGLNLGGNSKFGNTNIPIEISSDSGRNNLKPIDVGAGLNAGVILTNNFYVRIRYQMGFVNLEPDRGDSRYTTKTSALGITIGYYFGGKKKVKKGTGK